METILSLITLPIMLLNFGGGIVAGIWLIIIGKWALAVSALISTVISGWIIGFLMMPTMLFMAPFASEWGKKNKFLLFILGILSNVWTYGLMLVYSVGSFIYIFNNYDGGMIIPYLLLAYSVATSPWTYMASKEPNAGIGTLLPVFGVCVSSIAMMGEVFFYGGLDFKTLALVGIIPLGLAFIIQMIIVALILKAMPTQEKDLDEKILSGKADMADWLEFDGHITAEANKEIKEIEKNRI